MRGQLTRAGAEQWPFDRFEAVPNDRGYLAIGGRIVDAMVVEARRRRPSARWKTTIKGGGVSEHCSKAKPARIDRDGRRTVKRGRNTPRPDGDARTATQAVVPAFGSKNHIGVDRRFGPIRTVTLTHAAAHDGRQLQLQGRHDPVA